MRTARTALNGIEIASPVVASTIRPRCRLACLIADATYLCRRRPPSSVDDPFEQAA
ncbi:hypothetical protein ACLOJK_018768, partial [Asimina triloba]